MNEDASAPRSTDNQPVPSSASDKTPDVALEDGLTALKQKDFQTAIAHLEAVCQSTTSKSNQIKAQMGLVNAYRQSGNLKWAMALCEPLQESDNLKVQQWAMQALRSMTQQFQPPEPEPPSVKTSSAPSVPVQSSPEQSDLTGFVPLEETEQPRQRPRANGAANHPLHSPDAPATSQPTLDSSATLSPTDNPFLWESEERPAAPTEPTHSATSSDAELEDDEPTFIQAEEPTFIQVEGDFTGGSAAGFAVTESASDTAPSSPGPFQWRNAERAKRWASLGKVDVTKLWGIQGLTAIALVTLMWGIAQFKIGLFNGLVMTLRWPFDFSGAMIYDNPLPLVIICLVVLFAVFPWLMDALLSLYSAKTISFDQLGRFSPEAVSLLRKTCGQRKLPFPSLRLLETDEPLCFTYGHLPQTARIVMSQGVFTRLNEDEIAALYALELGHIKHHSISILSFIAFLCQIFYEIYWRVGNWGTAQRDRVLKSIAVGVVSLSYGVFWLIRGVGLLAARLRIYFSDRTACELTGNPNGLTRALLKLCLGTVEASQRQKQAPPWLERLDLLTPVGYYPALTPGSAAAYGLLEPILQWDYSNPYRHWLAISNTHPPLGDRLQLIGIYAHHWRIQTELDLPTRPSSPATTNSLRRPQTFRQQATPYVGPLIGLLLGLALWVIGALSARLGAEQLSWMWRDRSILLGCILLGTSIGLFLRINRFFPDIRPSRLTVSPSWLDYLHEPTALPIESHPIKLQGTLLGKRGICNILAQDLLLHTPEGLIRLHWMPPLGPLANLFPTSIRPLNWVGDAVIVVGWLRQGMTPWVDVEALQRVHGTTQRSHHPLWSTTLAVLIALAGLWIILAG